jgi:hypothetical protein
VSVVFCQVIVSATSRSLVQRSLTECGVSEFDCKLSKMMRPWFTQEVAPWLTNLDSQSKNDPDAVTCCILPTVEDIPFSTPYRLIHSPKHVAELICTNNL